MGRLQIRTEEVEKANGILRQSLHEFGQAGEDIASLQWKLTDEVRGRRGIERSIRSIRERIEAQRVCVERLAETVERCVKAYRRTEEQVKKLGEQTADRIMAGMSGERVTGTGKLPECQTLPTSAEIQFLLGEAGTERHHWSHELIDRVGRELAVYLKQAADLGIEIKEWLEDPEGKVREKDTRFIVEDAALSLAIFRILRRIPSCSKEEETERNRKLEEQYRREREEGHGPYILEQEEETLRDMQMGTGNVGNCGCGSIAIYNAIRAVDGGEEEGQPMLTDILAYNLKENHVMLGGAFGVDPGTLESTLEHYGYEATAYTERYDKLTATKQPVVIVSCWNSNKSVGNGVHTFTLVAEEGKYVVYNGYDEMPGGPYGSVGEFWRKNGDRAPIIAITVAAGGAEQVCQERKKPGGGGKRR